MQPRVSQRPSLACRECTRRKRKCDKEIPCSRCVRLGLHCDREIIYLRRHISQNGPEIAFLAALREDLQSPLPSRVAKAVQKITERIDILQSGHAKDRRDGGSEPPESPKKEPRLERLSESSDLGTATGTSPDTPPDPDGQDSLIVTALEQIAWGRNYGNCYPHRHCACQYNRSWSELSSINSQSFQFARSPFAATVRLPPRELANVLVAFHQDYVAWHHNCLHSPTFLQQCHIFWETGECDQLQWLALYCAVLATSLFCLQHSSKYHAKYAYVPDASPYSAQALFQTMLDVLYESNFLQNLSLYAVQAIVISTEIAHNLGHSQLNATLISAAIRIAECLGVHKIRDTDTEPQPPGGVIVGDGGVVSVASTDGCGSGGAGAGAGVSVGASVSASASASTPALSASASAIDTPQERWCDRLEREVGRRVWLQMIIQDHFAIPFTDSYGIYPAQYATSVSRNANDVDLVPLPDDMPTVSSYTRVLSLIADIMPALAEGMGPLKARKPVHEQYAHVLAMDQTMRQVVRGIPRFFLQANPLLEAQIPWLAIARQSLAITAAEKIIMIHRPFMFRSFQSATYAATRRTCVSASMTILREHRNIREAGEVSMWTHTAFCITASLILCFELLCHREDPAAADASAQQTLLAQRAVYSDAVHQARQYLASRSGDVLAQRGVLLINAIFPGMPGVVDEDGTALPTISFNEIVSRFTIDWAILGLNVDMRAHSSSPADLRAGFAAPPVHAPDFEDFDAWFQHIFSNGAPSFE